MQISNIKNYIPHSQICFSGRLGADGYGVQEDRDALKYRLKLTPRRINDIMRDAKSIDEGLLDVFRELKQESRQVDKAFIGFKTINSHFWSVANSTIGHLNEDIKKGFVRHLASRAAGGKGNLESQLYDVGIDFDEIVQTHFNQGLATLANSYEATTQYFQEGIEYVNMRKGSSPWREKLLERTRELLEKHNKTGKNFEAALEKQVDLLVNRSTTVLENYSKRTGKSVIKVVKWAGKIARIFAGGG